LLEGLREYAIELVRSNYADFGPSLAAEMLLTKHDVKISRETLRKWMMGDGLWLSRKQRHSFHQPRLRREAFGELIQIDGSDHRWFENRGDACTLRLPRGGLEVRSKGLLLPYTVFSKDQRVSHTAIVENKRLGHTLALSKAQQDSHFESKVKTNSEKGEYKKRGRQISMCCRISLDELPKQS
jgi:hypothetical protein